MPPGRSAAILRAGCLYGRHARYFHWGLWSSCIRFGGGRKNVAPGSCQQQPRIIVRRRYRGPYGSGTKYVFNIQRGPLSRPLWYSGSCWRGHGRSPDGEPRQKTPDNPTGVRPGHNIEDVERNAMEFLLYGEKGRKTGEHDFVTSAIESVRKWIAQDTVANGSAKEPSKTTPPSVEPENSSTKTSTSVDSEGSSKATATNLGPEDMADQKYDGIRETTATDDEYIIDPITNRKVPKSTASAPEKPGRATTEIPAKTSESHDSQFAESSTQERKPSSPASSDGLAASNELSSHRPVASDAVESPTNEVSKTATESVESQIHKDDVQSIDHSETESPTTPEKAAKSTGNRASTESSTGPAVGGAEPTTNASKNKAESWPGYTNAFDSTRGWLERLRHMTWNPPEEERAEDLDLLRPSDVRSSAGIRKDRRSSRPSDESKPSWETLEGFLVKQGREIEENDIQASRSIKERREKARAQDLAGFRPKSDSETKKPKSGLSGGMTGNYVRDFPEEFAASWATSNSPSQASLYPAGRPDLEDSAETPKELVKADTMEGDDTSRITPALDRQVSKRSEGPAHPAEIAVDAQNALKEVDRAFIRELRQIYEESYGKLESTIASTLAALSKSGKESPSTDSSTPTPSSHSTTKPPSTSAPTLYKILAYDPTMQTINEAETTSFVPDTSAALTPAEVLLRLSNPSKFFPHFKPLQEQGFGIASGSGDVLVFRKVREPASAVQPASTAATSTPSEEIPKPPTAEAAETLKSAKDTSPAPAKAVNPIDLMGRDRDYEDDRSFGSAMWTTSPTGFVNYNSLRSVLEEYRQREAQRRAKEEEQAVKDKEPNLEKDDKSTGSASAPSGFKSNIEVCREEPVFSGSKEWAAESAAAAGGKHSERAGGKVTDARSGDKKKSLAKRMLVGAAWVGALSYAVGVVSEYFVTGGIDGKGPTGF